MNKTILLVEDEVAMLKALNDKFTDAGFNVFESKNGQDGLNIATSKHPDVIMLDILMPKMDGITFFKKLRQDEWGKDAKVIVLSNVDMDSTLVEGVHLLNPSGYYVKSDWKLDEIIKKTSELLSAEK